MYTSLYSSDNYESVRPHPGDINKITENLFIGSCRSRRWCHIEEHGIGYVISLGTEEDRKVFDDLPEGVEEWWFNIADSPSVKILPIIYKCNDILDDIITSNTKTIERKIDSRTEH